MNIEILFLDGEGKFRCSLRSSFPSSDTATRYAQSVMQTRCCRHYALAEIYAPGSLLLATVLNESTSRRTDPRGRLQNAKPARKLKPLYRPFAVASERSRQPMTGSAD